LVAVRGPSGEGSQLERIDPEIGIAPGDSVALLLTGPGCEVLSLDVAGLRAAQPGALSREAGRGSGFRIVSDVPVVAHQVNPFLGAQSFITGASLLFPTPTWGDNYVALAPALSLAVPPDLGGSYDPTLNLVAAENGTEVTVLATAALDGGGDLPTLSVDQPITFELDAGEHAQFMGSDDFTGTIVQASGPLGVWVGHECAFFPEEVAACDHLEQMLPSVRNLPSQYVGAGVKRASEAVAWRVFAAVDGTELSWSTDVGGPTSLDRGDSAYVVTGTPFVVSSQDDEHPFYLFNYMTGQSAIDVDEGTHGGDPDFVLAPPPQQFLDRYTFFVDPTYTTQLVVVRGQSGAGSDGSAGGFSDVELRCSGQEPTQVSGWRDVVGGSYQYARVSTSCAGQMQADSAAPFGIHVWGIYEYASVGYPAGLGLRELNGLDVPPVP